MKQETETQIIEYSQTEAALAHLREKYAGIEYDVQTPEGMKLAKSARIVLRGYRTGLEKTRKHIKAEALKRCKLIDGEANRITAELRALEDPIAQQIQAEDDRIEAERQAKIEAEEQRVSGILARIEDIRCAAEPIAYDTPARDIDVVISQVVKIDIDDSFEEFRWQAQDAKEAMLARLRELYRKAAEREAEEARIAKEREELAQLRAKQERQEAIRTRIAEIRAAASFFGEPASALVAAKSREVDAIKIDASFEEFTEEAQAVKAATIAQLRDLHAAAVEREEAEAKRRAELEEREAKLAADRKRDARKQEVRNQIATIVSLPSKGYQMTAAELTRLLSRAEGFAIEWTDDDDPALRKEADAAKAETVSAVRSLLDGRKQYETEQEEAERREREREAAERAESERKRKAEADARKKKFPGEAAIINALVEHFGITEKVARAWLSEYSQARAA